ncbi:MAG: molybdopterin-guanine dinucleotide biosynthesis protein B [Armatimonadetes bacterium]|nr:molybdopterin-guanine dinucleotide biosynthesis protein B [Armatimonadota bacterium]NIM23267.1 molybdopterin-guanine dinucleotide biosynthesis protein B [Armatimonadota bacterium]NIM67135.1 molybdopterin-guanine dinucleotide biosynthesis protein B [Armatimonadota bacterium]NIM75662.1 molybdopterin-guanine dinucleotide biosynthesis protein B [Armatimonadota bacterium]NIN05324.1 molybdopterin-guanine dinucleotide biosynthesis protein B [Armatimonadota bacterium]
MLPIVSIIGAKKSGKTTVVEALVKEFSCRGLRVATMKHCEEGFQVDREGSDSWRHIQAGAIAVSLCGPQEFAILGASEKPSFARLAALLLEEAQLVIAEGFSEEDLPKVLVVGKEAGESPIPSEEQLLAVVSDVSKEQSVPTFGFDDTASLADLLVERLLAPEREVSLIVEGRQVRLNHFADSVIASTVRGMIAALRDIPEEPETINLQIHRRK